MIDVVHLPASIAAIQVSSHRCCPAVYHIGQRLSVAGQHVLCVACHIPGGKAAHNTGNPVHDLQFRHQMVDGRVKCIDAAPGQVRVNGGGRRVFVTEGFLDGYQIDAVFDQMGGL